MDYGKWTDDVIRVLSPQDLKYDYVVRPCGLSALKCSWISSNDRPWRPKWAQSRIWDGLTQDMNYKDVSPLGKLCECWLTNNFSHPTISKYRNGPYKSCMSNSHKKADHSLYKRKTPKKAPYVELLEVEDISMGNRSVSPNGLLYGRAPHSYGRNQTWLQFCPAVWV